MSVRASGRLGERDGSSAVVFERTFRAPMEDVWAAVTESDRLSRWICTWTGDPASGSVMVTMTAEGDDVTAVEHQILACEPPRHLALRSHDDLGAWLMHLDLEHAAGVTTLRFTQLVDDPSMIENVGSGWDWYLDRLVAAETGGELPQPEDFERDYAGPLLAHYVDLRKQLEG